MDLPSRQNGTGHWFLDIKGWSNASAQSSAHSYIYSNFRSGTYQSLLFHSVGSFRFTGLQHTYLFVVFQAIYPFLTWLKLVRKPLHKMIWGGILAACAFIISGIVELNLLVSFFKTVIYVGFVSLALWLKWRLAHLNKLNM